MMSKKYTKALALFLSVASLSFLNTPVSFAAEEEEETEIDYSGAIHISDAKELISFANECKLGSDLQRMTVVLDADIDLMGVNDFTGIDTFSGAFNGDGHKVSGINLTSGSGSIGFFGFVEEGAVVENLTVDATIYSTDNNNYIGLLAGTNAGTIRNCTAEGIATGTGNTAGIVGYNGGNGKVLNCVNEAAVYSLTMVAGIAGENLGSISECTNKGEINADSSWLDFEDNSVGTLSVESIIKSIHDTIDVGSDIGGIAGYSNGSISNCANEGIVGYQHAGKNVGGIAGRFCRTITDCKNTGKVYGKQDVGGIAGQFEPTILETGEDISTYLDELGDLSDQLVKDTSAAGASSESSLKKAADKIKDTGNEATGDINETTDKLNKAINDEATRSKNRISDAGNTIKSLQSDIANTNRQEVENEVADDISAIDYDSVISKIDTLSEGIDKAQSTVGNYDVSGTENRAKEHIDSTAKSGTDEISDTGNTINNRINEATGDVSEDLYELSNEIASTRATLTKDINAINSKVADIANLAEEQASNFRRIADGEDIIEDYSAVDADNEAASRILNCVNEGYVNGDRNVGGVAGALAIDGTDANDEHIKTEGNKYVTLAVLENSSSNGILELRKENAGGIVGNSSLGLIRKCEAKDRIISEEGNYVGGIVGYAQGTVSDCYSASDLEGANYVGGICGAAKKVRNCYTLSEISSDVKWGGEVIGDVIKDSKEDITTAHSKMMNSIFNNYYVKEKLGGINNVSYSGIAEAISYENLIASEVGSHFDKLNVYFYDGDYKLVSAQTVDYGSDVESLDYPELSTGENMHLVWNGIYSNIVNGNMFLIAEDADDVTVLSSDWVVDGKPVALVQGVYYEISKLNVQENKDMELPSVTKRDGSIVCYDVSLENTAVTDSDVSLIRFLVGSDKNAKVYKLSDGSWKEVSTKSTGSYVESNFSGSSATFALEVYEDDSSFLIIIGAAVIIVLLLVLANVYRFHKKKKANNAKEV